MLHHATSISQLLTYYLEKYERCNNGKSKHNIMDFIYNFIFYFSFRIVLKSTLYQKNLRIGKNKILLMERGMQQSLILDQMKI